MQTLGRWIGFVFGVLVAGRAGGEGAEYRLAINVDVKDVRLNVRDLTEIVATRAGEFSRVTVIPDNRIQEAISEERASINQKCKAGQLDQKCQISLGGDLGATYWLQVSVVRGGKSCSVRISCLSIAHGVQEASALESAPCDSDAVTKAIGAGLSKVSAKLGWGGAEATPAPAPAPALAPVAASDPLADEKARLAEAKREKAEAAARQKQHLADATRDYAEVEKTSKDAGAPVEARLMLVARFLAAYADAPEQARALKLKERLEAEAQKARAAADQKAAASVPADMVFVPAGKFWFGCNEDVDKECEFDEKPGTTIELPAFLIDKTEVTVADYARCVEAGQCSRDGLSMPWYEGKAQADAAKYCNWGRAGREQHPINCLDWAQARDFCRFKDKRLPSAPEWEKAARGTDGRKYAWTDQPAPGEKITVAEKRKQALAAIEKGHALLGDGKDKARVDQAILFYQKALRLEPNLARAERALGVAYAAKRDDKNALQHYKRFIELDPAAPEAWQVKAIIEKFEKDNHSEVIPSVGRADALQLRVRANIIGIEDGFDGTSPVGSFPAGASPFGALDMIGNVWEWCENDYAAGKKVLRGGSWFDPPRSARASFRSWEALLVRLGSIGVRCAQSVP